MEAISKKFLFNKNNEENAEMRCNICDKYLSVSPIYYNNYLGNICGRCENNEDVEETKQLKNKKSIMERQRIFEFVAEHLTFPCIFRSKGCPEELRWGEVEAHEVSCLFKIICCPLSNADFLIDNDEKCHWTGESINLMDHIRDSHDIYFTNFHRITLGIETSSILGPLFGTDAIKHEPKFQSKFLFSNLLDTHFILILHYEKKMNTYFCQVLTDLSFYKCKSIEYQLEIFDENKKNSIILPRKPIRSLIQFSGKTYIDGALEVDLNYINKILRMPHFIYMELRLLKNDALLNTRSYRSSSVSATPRMLCDKQLSNMKCNECKKLLYPPVSVCEMGHNICSQCRTEETDTCDVCGLNWCESTNVTMERLCSVLKFPCKNRDVGCFFAAPMPDIYYHEMKCRPTGLILRECVVKSCRWKDYDFKTHVKQGHPMLSLNELTKLKPSSHFISYDDHIFFLEIECEHQEFYTYEITCCETDELKYRYELQFIDTDVQMNMNGRISFNHFCTPEYVKTEGLSEDVVVLPFKIFAQFFSHFGNIMFKVNISPISDY